MRRSIQRESARAVAERLEPRRMLANISGTSGDDNVIIYTEAGQAHFVVNGVDHTTTDTAVAVNFNAMGGNDTVYLDVINTFNIAIFLGSGDDYITNYNPFSNTGSLSRVDHDLFITGDAGNDTLAIDDTSSFAGTYTMGDRFLNGTPTSGFFFYDNGPDRRWVYADIENITLDEGHGGVNHTTLYQKPPDVRMKVTGGDGTDEFIVGGGDLDSQGWSLATTTVFGGAGNDTIEFDDRSDRIDAAEIESITAQGFTLSKGAAGFNYSSFETAKIDAAAQNDVNVNGPNGFVAQMSVSNFNSTVNLFATGPNTSVISGGTTIVNVTNGNLSQLGGVVNLFRSSSSSNFSYVLNINDQNSTSNDNYVVSASQLVKNPGSASKTINFTGLDAQHSEEIHFNGPSGSNTISIGSVPPAPSSLTVDAGGGPDAIILGGGNLDSDVTEAITVTGGGGVDSLYFDNSADPDAESQSLDGTTFTDDHVYSFNNFESVLINEGPGGETLSLNKVLLPTSITGNGGGADVVNVGAGNLAANWLASVMFTGNLGSDRLLIDDHLRASPGNYQFDVGDFFHASNVFRQSSAAGAPTITTTLIPDRILQAGNSDDTIAVNSTSAGLSIFGNAGNDRINVLDSDAAVKVDSGSEILSLLEPLGDYLTVNGDSATSGDSPASVRLTASDTIDKLTINSAGALQIPTNVALFAFRNLTLNGVIDLAGGAMIVQQFANVNNTVKSWTTSGYAAGAWNGTAAGGAINSSLAAGSALGDAVGFARGSDAGISSIDGLGVDPGDTLVRYTLYGDSNLDAHVDVTDLGRLASNWQGTGKTFSQGDFSYDGVVDVTDLGGLATNWQGALSAAATAVLMRKMRGPRINERELDLLN